MSEVDLDAVTWPVQLTKTCHRDVYPLLKPSNPDLSAAGKTVLITGVSGGVGKAIAEAWATAGAAAVVITGRKADILEQVAAALREIPNATQTKVVALTADLTSESEVEGLWAKARAEVGVVDVLINDAGRMNWGAIGDMQPSDWWLDFEVNVKGTYLMTHHFVKQQSPAKGTVITLNSGAMGMSLPSMSSYVASKLASARVMEVLHAEQPDVRSFTMLPGLLKTAMTAEAFLPFARDDPVLSGGMTLFLSTPRADWLRGSIVSVNWDIEEMEAHKDEIVKEGRTKLAFLNAKLQKGGHPWA